MHWKDAIARALRTFLQAFLGVLLTSWLALNLAPGELPAWDVAQRVLIAAAIAGVIALVTWLQNFLEDASGRALFYKDNPAQRIAEAERTLDRATP
jgi:hypothetical protein